MSKIYVEKFVDGDDMEPKWDEKRIDDLKKVLHGHIDEDKMIVHADSLHITVTEEVDIIIDMVGPLYEVWIQNHVEGEGCTVARNESEYDVASFILAALRCSSNWRLGTLTR